MNQEPKNTEENTNINQTDDNFVNDNVEIHVCEYDNWSSE